jgi:hypothetical protein
MYEQPTLCVMYFLNYVDRNAIAQARLNNLEDDLRMSGVEFNTCVSMSVLLVCISQPSRQSISGTWVEDGETDNPTAYSWATSSCKSHQTCS